MYDLFFEQFSARVPLSSEDREIITHYLKPKKIRRKQYLLQDGDVCKAYGFVTKGALRQYSLDESGNERIIQFAIEGWMISDLFSFLTGEPATYNIDAVEDSELLLIDKHAHEEMLRKLPVFETFTRMLMTNAYIAMQRRLTSIISLSLEERYLEFNKNYPAIVQRFPQHMIASYMGLTPETLSRVRKKLVSKK